MRAQDHQYWLGASRMEAREMRRHVQMVDIRKKQLEYAPGLPAFERVDINDPESVRNALSIRLAWLTPRQLDYINTRMQFETDKEAQDKFKISRKSVLAWGEIIPDTIKLLKMNVLRAAHARLVGLAYKAVLALDAELSGVARLSAAKDILDRVGIRAAARMDITSGGKSVGDVAGSSTEERLARLSTIFSTFSATGSGEVDKDQPLDDVHPTGDSDNGPE